MLGKRRRMDGGLCMGREDDCQDDLYGRGEMMKCCEWEGRMDKRL